MLLTVILLLFLSHAAQSSVVRIPFGKTLNQLSKRDDLIDEPLVNARISYKAEFELGSPPQKMLIMLDTGSSDLWVMSADNPSCDSSAGIDCSDYNIFNYANSTTFSPNSSAPFEIAYADGTGASGIYAQDTLVLGGVRVENANFALAMNATSTPVWGIGLASLESTMDYSEPYVYPSIPYQLKDSGAIAQVAYSLWLNGVNSSDGEILFGGINAAKFEGDLSKLPLVPYGNQYVDRFAVMLQGISLANDQGVSAQIIGGGNLPIVLDSGSTSCSLSENMIQAIVYTLGDQVQYNSELEEYTLSCNSITGSIAFNISGFNIEVQLGDFFITLDTNGHMCSMGIQTGSSLIIGDNALRSVYTVFDLENKEVGLAAAVFDNSSSNIVALSSGIPASEASGYSSTELNSDFSYFPVSTLFRPSTSSLSQVLSASGMPTSSLGADPTGITQNPTGTAGSSPTLNGAGNLDVSSLTTVVVLWLIFQIL